MDISDQATKVEERDRAAALEASRRANAVLPDLGHCHNCEGPVSPGARFCGPECREDYDLRMRSAARNGLRRNG